MKEISLFSIMLLLVMACGGRDESVTTAEPVEVGVTLLTSRFTEIPVTAAGRITTREEIRLSFKKGGIVDEILVREGESVVRDQILASLKQDEFLSARTQAELAVEKSERDFSRVSNLYEDSVATLEQYQNAQTALELARQTLTGTLFNVEHTVIRAPANGRILKKLALAGEIVGEGTPVILFGSTDSQWVMRTSLSDHDAVRVALGDSAGIHTDAWPDRNFAATVTEISGMADPYTGTFDIELMLNPGGERLVTGLIGTAVIFPSDASAYWLVPSGALIEGTGREARIYEMVDGRAKELTLHVEAVRGGTLYVPAHPGDTLYVITSGYQYIGDGMPVRPID